MVPRRSFGRFFGLTFLGTILPGAGLMLSRRVKSGLALLLTFVLLAVGAAVYFATKGVTKGALLVAVDPNVLLVIAVVAVIGLVVWLSSVLWTAEINWPSPPTAVKRFFASLTVLLACLSLVVPSSWAVYNAFVQRDLIGDLFTGSSSSRRGVSPGLDPDDPWVGVPRVNLLLLGSDAAPNRPGVRTDSIMLASIDTVSGDTVLFGLPRNLENVPFPESSPLHKLFPQGLREGPNCPRDCLLNEVWQQGEDHKDLYPGESKPGLTAVKEAVEGITGLTPDYSVVINMAGFTALVNAMGGVDINVRERVPIGGRLDEQTREIVPGSIHGWIEPGPQHLDGYHAMWYSRGRATTDDFSRMRRQRCMVGALVRQVNPTTMLQRYPAIAKVAKDNVYTDVPQSHLSAWAVLVDRMQGATIRSLPFTNKVVKVGNPDYPKIQRMVHQAITDPEAITATPSPMPTPTSSPTSATKSPVTSRPTRTEAPAPANDQAVKVDDAC